VTKVRLKLSESTENEIAIVVDVLRATTTITTALYRGAQCIIPTKDAKSAFKMAKEHNALLMGERGCIKIRGFDFGNSPLEITEKIVGRKIVFTSTNFPKPFFASAKSPIILIGCLLNVTSTTKEAYNLAVDRGLDICYMLAGLGREDLAFVGISGMILNLNCDDKVKEAIKLVRKKGLEPCIKEASHAKRLVKLGFKEDVEFACKKDCFDIIVFARNGMITKYAKYAN
jgi:2-phosphosulfolactate phosphatase